MSLAAMDTKSKSEVVITSKSEDVTISKPEASEDMLSTRTGRGQLASASAVLDVGAADAL
jgi:hypothetical protein